MTVQLHTEGHAPGETLYIAEIDGADVLGDDVEVLDLGCTGMTRAAAAQDRQLIWIRKAGGSH